MRDVIAGLQDRRDGQRERVLVIGLLLELGDHLLVPALLDFPGTRSSSHSTLVSTRQTIMSRSVGAPGPAPSERRVRRRWCGA